VTVLVDQPNNQLVLYFSISGTLVQLGQGDVLNQGALDPLFGSGGCVWPGTGLGDAELGAKQAVWEYGNSFRLLASDPTASLPQRRERIHQRAGALQAQRALLAWWPHACRVGRSTLRPLLRLELRQAVIQISNKQINNKQ